MIKAINSKLSFPVLASPWPLPEGVKVTSPGPGAGQNIVGFAVAVMLVIPQGTTRFQGYPGEQFDLAVHLLVPQQGFDKDMAVPAAFVFRPLHGALFRFCHGIVLLGRQPFQLGLTSWWRLDLLML